MADSGEPTWTVFNADVSDEALRRRSMDPNEKALVGALATEVLALRDVVRELVRNDGFYGGAPCWMKGSLADDACKRALAKEASDDR